MNSDMTHDENETLRRVQGELKGITQYDRNYSDRLFARKILKVSLAILGGFLVGMLMSAMVREASDTLAAFLEQPRLDHIIWIDAFSGLLLGGILPLIIGHRFLAIVLAPAGAMVGAAIPAMIAWVSWIGGTPSDPEGYILGISFIGGLVAATLFVFISCMMAVDHVNKIRYGEPENQG